MTGYELLEAELTKRFNASKVQSNQPFIHAIVEIMTEDQDAKMAISLAEKIKADAEQIKQEVDRKCRENENSWSQLFCNQQEIKRRENECDKREKELQKREEELQKLAKTITECETAEARDKLRMAAFFLTQTDTRDDPVAFTRGLSNILGNGGSKNDRI